MDHALIGALLCAMSFSFMTPPDDNLKNKNNVWGKHFELGQGIYSLLINSSLIMGLFVTCYAASLSGVIDRVPSHRVHDFFIRRGIMRTESVFVFISFTALCSTFVVI